jgi:exopolysaccharide biosynthesis predicted pyruvyltransferase EpsI
MDQRIVDRFERENGELAAMLRDLHGQRVAYFPNPGNAGDSLIAAATYQLLDHYGVQYDVVHTPQDASALRGQVVVLGGGGNLVPLYHGMATIADRLIPGGNSVILLPHSVRGNEELLGRLPEAWTLFCREIQSWRHVQRHASACNVRLGHDLGLYLDIDRLRASVDRAAVDERFRSMLTEGTKLTAEALTDKAMSCMRHGAERTSVPAGPNYDVSVVFATGVAPGSAELGAWMMLEFARRAAQITTNRLHIGIAAALVGTPVVLHDNSYGKVSGVYLNSMRGRFPHVSFAGEMRTEAVFAPA